MRSPLTKAVPILGSRLTGSPGMRAANEYSGPATVNLSLGMPTMESEVLGPFTPSGPKP